MDMATSIWTAVFLEGEGSATIWNNFVRCWSRLFVGDQEEIVTNQNTCFVSEEFRNFCNLHSIRFRHTPTEHHNNPGIGER